MSRFVFLVCFLAACPLWPCGEYDRQDWPHWSAGDRKGDRLDTRQELLAERSLAAVTIECGKSLPKMRIPGVQYVIKPKEPRRCRVASGRWLDQYAGIEIVAETAKDVARLVTVEHVVPLAEAHRSGGSCWDRELRRKFANDKRFLLIVGRSVNSSRNDSDRYLPSHRPCDQVRLYTATKSEYSLNYDLKEGSFYGAHLALCQVP